MSKKHVCTHWKSALEEFKILQQLVNGVALCGAHIVAEPFCIVKCFKVESLRVSRELNELTRTESGSRAGV